jgi:hypothetical protein
MHTDICFFDRDLQPIGDILYNVSITNQNTWKSFNRISGIFEGQAIPVKKLSKGMKKILENNGMPQNAVFIQR